MYGSLVRGAIHNRPEGAMKPPIVLVDIDGTLISEVNGRYHPILVPLLVALQGVISIEVFTARRHDRLEDTYKFLDDVGLNVPVRYNTRKEPPINFKKRAIDEACSTNTVVLVIDDDLMVLQYAASRGIKVVLP